jgi:hypothetical protein
MNMLITIEVHVPDPLVTPQQVVAEITSNIESCDWTVVSTFYEIIEERDHAND